MTGVSAGHTSLGDHWYAMLPSDKDGSLPGRAHLPLYQVVDGSTCGLRKGMWLICDCGFFVQPARGFNLVDVYNCRVWKCAEWGEVTLSCDWHSGCGCGLYPWISLNLVCTVLLLVQIAQFPAQALLMAYGKYICTPCVCTEWTSSTYYSVSKPSISIERGGDRLYQNKY